MGKRIAVVGTGALGGYVGGYLAHHGQDVTLIDMWPENIEAIRARGLELDGVTPEEKFTEIDFMNGFIVDKGKMLGIPTPSYEKLVGLVRRLERGEISAAPSHLGG